MELPTSANVEVANVEVANVEAANVEVANVEAANVEAANVEAANVEVANMEVANVEVANVEVANMEVANVELAKFLTLDKPNAKIKWRCPEYAVKMLEEGSHADITLEAEGGSVKAHRSVLASVSPLFAKEFELSVLAGMSSDIAAKFPSTTMRISNMSIDALKVLLLLLYTTKDNNDGGIPELHAAIDTHFGKLCEAFSKYQVSDLLKSVHICALARNLNPTNCWVLYFQSLSDDKTTATHTCYNYILGNFEKVIKSNSILGAMQFMPDKVCLVLRKAESHSLCKKALQKFESKKRLAIEE